MLFGDFIDSIVGALKFKNLDFTKIKYSTRFTSDEAKKTVEYLEQCGCLPEWSRSVCFYWNDKMGKETIACWTWDKPDLVFVTSSFRFDYNNENFKKIIAPIAHELHHKKQYNRYGLLFFLLLIPIVRNFTIEIGANRVTVKVNKFFKIPEGEWL